ncbi:MAG: Gfo/Idh/MocA family oxidoreductase [Balneolaceae bacterium]
MSEQKPIRFGVLGAAKIARKEMIPAIQQSKHAVVQAIASRSLDRAQEVADTFDIPDAHGSYEELLSNPAVDAVYIPLPNHLHVPWSLQAIEAGKHVLCEKPIGLSSEEAKELIQVADQYPDQVVMEAFMYRFHPRWKRTREIVKSKAIGQLTSIHSHFSYDNPDPSNIRNQEDIGGGGVMDVGCYSISLSRWLFGEEPVRLYPVIDLDPALGVDRHASVLMEFRKGTSSFTCATQTTRHQSLTIHGTEGVLSMPQPFNPPHDVPTELRITRKSGEEIVEPFEPCNQFTLQTNAFCRAILEGLPAPTPLGDALDNMRVIERVAGRP